MPTKNESLWLASGIAGENQARTLNLPIEFTRVAIGDASGAYPTLDENRTTLVNEVLTGEITGHQVDPNDANQRIIEMNIPPTANVDAVEILLYAKYGDTEFAHTYFRLATPFSVRTLQNGGSQARLKYTIRVSEYSDFSVFVAPDLAYVTHNEMKSLSATDVNAVSTQVRFPVIFNPDTHLFKKGELISKLDGKLTVVRDSSATYINEYGELKTAEPHQLRQEKQGWLIEGLASTNICTYSQAFTHTSYSAYNHGTLVHGIANIDGSNDAVKFVTSTINEKQQFDKSSYYSEPETVVTASVIVEQSGDYQYFVMASGNYASWETRGEVVFDLSSGTVVSETTEAGTGKISGVIEFLGNNRYRCQLRGQVRNTSTSVSNLYLTVREDSQINEFSGDGTSGVIIHNLQLENLPFATSYIPTQDEAVTRAAEGVSFPIRNNIGDLRSDFSLFCKVSFFGVTNPYPRFVDYAKVMVYLTTEVNERVRLKYLAGDRGYMIGSELQENHLYNICTVSTDVNDKLYLDGHDTEVITTGDKVSNLALEQSVIIFSNSLSGGGARPVCGHIKDLMIFKAALTAEEVRVLSQNA